MDYLNEIEVSQRHTLSECLELKAQAEKQTDLSLPRHVWPLQENMRSIFRTERRRLSPLTARRREAPEEPQNLPSAATPGRGDASAAHKSQHCGSRFIVPETFSSSEYETGITLCGGEWFSRPWKKAGMAKMGAVEISPDRSRGTAITYDERTGMLCFGTVTGTTGRFAASTPVWAEAM